MKKILLIVLALLLISDSPAYLVYRFKTPTGVARQAVYVKSNGWHTGFIVPAQAIQESIPELKQRFGNTPYLEFGWGDQGFYQATEITSGLTLGAMFNSAGSVIHAVAVPEHVESYYSSSKIEKLCLTAPAYAALIQFISDSFYKDKNGEILALKNGIYGNSQFYRAMGTYHILNTCNKWTAKGLERAGMDIYPAVNLTASSVMDYVQAYKQSSAMSSGKHLNAEQLPLASVECQ